MKTLESFYGPNAGYVLELYERYKQDPTAVDPETRALFQVWSPEGDMAGSDGAVTAASPAPSSLSSQGGVTGPSVSKIVAATALAHAIRERGHLGARLDPLGSQPPGDAALQSEKYGLSD